MVRRDGRRRRSLQQIRDTTRSRANRLNTLQLTLKVRRFDLEGCPPRREGQDVKLRPPEALCCVLSFNGR